MFEELFAPLKIGNYEIKNRLMVSPLATRLPDEYSYMTQRCIDHYVRRAKGGFGLIGVGFSAVMKSGRAQGNQLGIWCDEMISGHKELVDAVHAEGAKIFCQLHHAGREIKGGMPEPGEPVSASPTQCRLNGVIPRELTVEEIYEIVSAFGDAAVRAKKAGYDHVEIHAGNGYLINQFLSANSNKRTDDYGGSIGNRARILTEIIKDCKEKCGSEYPVSVRLNGDEHIQDGITSDECATFAIIAEESGACLINLTVSCYPTVEWMYLPGAFKQGYNAYISETVKKVVKIPVVCNGRISDPYVAVNILRSGKADIISLGRGQLAEPEFPNKIKAGLLDELCPCVACNQGCGLGPTMPNIGYVTCMVNPRTGNENLYAPKKTVSEKNVAVVGAGPGGMMAAWTVAANGHKVVLLEKSKKLGGQFNYACTSPGKQDIARIIPYYSTMCKKYNVDIRLNVEVSIDTLKELSPDVVILATGAIPLEPPILGIRNEALSNYIEVLTGKISVTGKKVLVAGGGMVACEVAEYIAERFSQVTMVEMKPIMAEGIQRGVRLFMLQRMKDLGIEMVNNAKIKEFFDDGVSYEKDGTVTELHGFDLVVKALGSRSYNPLEEQVREVFPKTFVIGDALNASDGFAAIREALKVASKI